MCHVGGLSAGLCYWHIRHLSVALARSALFRGSPCHCAPAEPPSLPPWPLLMGSLRKHSGHWGRRLMATDRSFFFFLDLVIKRFIYSDCPLIIIHVGHKYLSLCPLWDFYPHIFSSNFLVTIFFHVPNQPAKSLIIVHNQSQSVLCLTPGTGDSQMCYPKLHSQRRFSFTIVLHGDF